MNNIPYNNNNNPLFTTQTINVTTMNKIDKQRFIDILAKNKQLKSIVEKEQQEVNQLSEIIKTGEQEVNRLKEKHSQSYDFVLTKVKQLTNHNDSMEGEIEELKERKESYKEIIKELENTKKSYREEIKELEEIGNLYIEERFAEVDAIYDDDDDIEEQITEDEMWEVLIECDRQKTKYDVAVENDDWEYLETCFRNSPNVDSSIATELHPVEGATSLSFVEQSAKSEILFDNTTEYSSFVLRKEPSTDTVDIVFLSDSQLRDRKAKSEERLKIKQSLMGTVIITPDEFRIVTGEDRPERARAFNSALKKNPALKDYIASLDMGQAIEFCSLNSDIVSKTTRVKYILPSVRE